MPTIKTKNGGKVVLKNGKVSCSCCAPPPSGCCMYAAQALYDGLYSVDDLPDTIKVISAGLPRILNKGVHVFPVFTDIPGAFYGTTDEELEDVFVRLYDSLWRSGSGIGRGGVDCLIDGTPILEGGYEDQFANSYNVYNNYQGLNVGTADRLDVCTWGIPDIESGYKLFIKYNPSGSNAFKWTIEAAANIFVKTAPQKSPAGNYEFMGITIYTVS